MTKIEGTMTVRDSIKALGEAEDAFVEHFNNNRNSSEYARQFPTKHKLFADDDLTLAELRLMRNIKDEDMPSDPKKREALENARDLAMKLTMSTPGGVWFRPEFQALAGADGDNTSWTTRHPDSIGLSFGRVEKPSGDIAIAYGKRNGSGGSGQVNLRDESVLNRFLNRKINWDR